MNNQIEKCGIGDKNYPKAFIDMKGMLGSIYYIGNIEILNTDKAVAIVRSRKCSDEELFSYEAGKKQQRWTSSLLMD